MIITFDAVITLINQFTASSRIIIAQAQTRFQNFFSTTVPLFFHISNSAQ